MKDLPKQTASIFEKLSKGQFINANSNDAEQRELFSVIENHFNDLLEYFRHIGFRLEQGDDYFYFSRYEDKVSMERKLSTAFKWIDIVDFFKTFNNGFAPGFRFSPDQINEEVKVNGLLENKLQQVNKQANTGSSREQIQKLINDLEKEGFVEKIDEYYDQYKVMAAFHYLENLILAIEVYDDEEAESENTNK